MATKTAWKQLGSSDQGHYGQPGSQYTIAEATVESNGSRFRVKIKTEWGSNQGYLQANGGQERQYRADSLDELMRIALSAEKERDDPNERILTAIREAVYEAEDAA